VIGECPSSKGARYGSDSRREVNAYFWLYPGLANGVLRVEAIALGPKSQWRDERNADAFRPA
jgi:hypothetical protein